MAHGIGIRGPADKTNGFKGPEAFLLNRVNTVLGGVEMGGSSAKKKPNKSAQGRMPLPLPFHIQQYYKGPPRG